MRTHPTSGDGALMLLSAASGALDAISFIVFGKVFSAFMTGNLVFLGLGTADAFAPGGPDLGRVCIVVVAFSAGVFAAARLARRARRARRAHGTTGLTRSLGVVLGIELLFLGGWLVVEGEPSSAAATLLAVIAALAMGMQTSAIGSLEIKGVFTTAATGTLVNLSREAADRRVTQADPARMARVLVGLVLGALGGGLLLVHAHPLAAALPPLLTLFALALLTARAPVTAGD
ncbi:uncharacterized membrane protein YoaK (UPF0700 family) [Solirubrobacter pauli]|uniref:Uncharacterized membrane protein YoaK (UPF0700 family) n=1 Tax=Solirubrobacter pauli TaxID=166793 RepID=A0A660L1L7_9ACTN|nr:YoaK family protein [Solirubrobacter pauli]RKQ86819.1 uncharacterized membrane protein YoaK (UPF0700 family) [Solirubrobacter pauli]